MVLVVVSCTCFFFIIIILLAFFIMIRFDNLMDRRWNSIISCIYIGKTLIYINIHGLKYHINGSKKVVQIGKGYCTGIIINCLGIESILIIMVACRF